MTNADLRLELFDGVRWFPMEFPRDDEAVTFDVLRRVAHDYVSRGAAKSVRVQRREGGSGWVTLRVISVKIIEEMATGTIFKSSVCQCGHLQAHHDGFDGFGGAGRCAAHKHCACPRFELREV